jgi:glycosyltransferase involved in cell wall biosynthesis
MSRHLVHSRLEMKLRGHNWKQTRRLAKGRWALGRVCIYGQSAGFGPFSMKIVHIITGLNTGGAEVMLRELLKHSPRPQFESQVISLTGIGPIGQSMRELGFQVSSLGMRPQLPDPGALWRLSRRLKRQKPDVVQTWLYHGDLIGGLAARLAGIEAVAWGIHISWLDAPQSKKSTLAMVKAGALLSPFVPRRIVCCAQSALELHERIGYDRTKMQVIPNGFDLGEFKPDEGARDSVRRELGLESETPLVGLIGRFHPQKDHENFVRAARIVAKNDARTRFVLIGSGNEWSNEQLNDWIESAGLKARFHLLGRRDDVARLSASFDVLALSSSYGEAFPLVVGQAMACQVPCAVTDVGDSADLVGDTGRIVAPRDAPALAQGIRELLDLGLEGRAALGQRARRRIEERFSIQSVAARYHELYREIAG